MCLGFRTLVLGPGGWGFEANQPQFGQRQDLKEFKLTHLSSNWGENKSWFFESVAVAADSDSLRGKKNYHWKKSFHWTSWESKRYSNYCIVIFGQWWVTDNSFFNMWNGFNLLQIKALLTTWINCSSISWSE